MTRMIFAHLAVSDLARARDFYTGLGFPLNPQFSDDNVASIVVSDEIIVMLLSPGFADQQGLAVSGAQTTSLALSAESREEVDGFMEKAVSQGAASRGDAQDLGFMYSRGIVDPDGHLLDFVWMDPAAVQA